MTTYTTLLGLAKPVTGQSTGEWGNIVNDALTSLVDTAVAGTTTITADSNVILTSTAGIPNEARQAIIRCTGNRTAIQTITAPAQSKTYVVINATTGSPSAFAVKIVAAGQVTGVTIPNGRAYTVAYNGSDFVVTSITTVDLATDVTGVLPFANGGTSANTRQGAINALVGTQTANRVLRSDGTNSALAQVALTTDVTGTLPIANGGTNSTAAAVAGAVVYSTSTAYAVTAAGTTGQVLTSAGASAPTWSNLPTNVSSITFGTTGLTPSTATTGAVTVSGTLATTNGGTGASSLANASIPTYSSTDTLSNKTIQARVVALDNSASITINGNTTDIATQANTQIAGNLEINAPTGTPFNGQKLMLRLLCTNVQTFVWNAIFQGSADSALPTTSSGASKYDYIGFIYNSTAAKWQMVAKNFGF
jgi:YD repeat-containing protein